MNGEYSQAVPIIFSSRAISIKLALAPIWRAKAELKGKTFDWILLKRKILTANNLAKRG